MRNLEKRIEELEFILKFVLGSVCVIAVIVLSAITYNQYSMVNTNTFLNDLANIAQVVIAIGVVIAVFQYWNSLKLYRVEREEKEREYLFHLLEKIDDCCDEIAVNVSFTYAISGKERVTGRKKGIWALSEIDEICRIFQTNIIKDFETLEFTIEKVKKNIDLIYQVLSYETYDCRNRVIIKDRVRVYVELIRSIKDVEKVDELPTLFKGYLEIFDMPFSTKVIEKYDSFS